MVQRINKLTKIRRKKRNNFERAQARAFYIIMIPFVLFLLLTKGYPIIWGLYISLTNFTGYNLNELVFVGLDNFKRVFTDTEALPSIGRVLGIGAISVPCSLAISIGLSLLLTKQRKGTGIFLKILLIALSIPVAFFVILFIIGFIKAVVKNF